MKVTGEQEKGLGKAEVRLILFHCFPSEEAASLPGCHKFACQTQLIKEQKKLGRRLHPSPLGGAVELTQPPLKASSPTKGEED